MATPFLIDQITRAQAQLIAYQDALLAVTTGGVKSFALNTGQTTQSVTPLDAGMLNDQIDALLNRIATLEARCYGSAVQVVPGW